MRYTVARLPLVIALAAGCAGCEILQIAEKIDKIDLSDNPADDTMELTAPMTPIALGAMLELHAMDACTEGRDDCDNDIVTITSARAQGAFEVESFDGDVVTIRARDTGDGSLAVVGTIDGERDSVELDLESESVIDVSLAPSCRAESSPMVAAGARLSLRYRLLGEGGELAGELEPPLETDLSFSHFGSVQAAVYEVPEQAGPIQVASALDGRSLLDLEAFEAEQASVALTLPDRLDRARLLLQVEQRIDGRRPCVESDDVVVVRSQTRDICLLFYGNLVMEASSSIGSSFWLDVLRPGTCVLAYALQGESTGRQLAFEVTGP